MRILIVGSEPGSARRLAEGVEATGGGSCFDAQSAEEAVEIVNREGVFDVLVTDVLLEGADGFTLFETLVPHLPELRAIFLSESDIPQNADRSGGWPVLPKSIEPGALAFAVQHLSPPSDPASLETPPDPLVGLTLGNYRIESVRGVDRDGNFYHAVQANIERPVELHALDPALAADPAQIERFLADARTKANVHHPALLSVFEAGEQDGVYFYTSENRNGSSLAELAERGGQIEPRVALQLLHSVAEVMVHIAHEKIPHEPLRPAHILVDHRRRARVVNVAISQPTGVSAVQEMRALAAMIAPVVAASDQARKLQQLLFEMESDSVTLRSWNALLYEVKRCATGASSPHFHRLDADGRAAIEAVGAARKRERRTRLAIMSAILLAFAAGGFWAWKVFRPGPVPESAAFENMIRIPAGEFTFQDGRKINLPDFWIDAHEVTIGQYAEFLAWIEANPERAGELIPAGATVPGDHSYVPAGWADEKTAGGTEPGYYSLARAGGNFQGSALTLSAPVFGVDWFDANAYAAWKGRRLPSDEEWEKAALGGAGKKFPCGDEWKPGAANISRPDGFEKWSPVDAVPADRSPGGVIGTAGNVSEWTQTVTKDAEGRMRPVIRGGNWSDAELDIRRRLQNLDALQNAPTVGFRTVSDKPPQP